MSYCECDYDYDRPEFYTEAVVKARKPHRCTECFGPIFIGEHYKRRSGKWDGRVENYPECRRCMELRQWATISMPCFCANTFGSLHENAWEMVRDIANTIPGFFFEFGRRMVKIERHAKQPLPARMSS
jgi:hypothetical protein